VDCATRAGLEVIKWDKDETAKGGPFPEILTDCDVFVNCILLQVGGWVGGIFAGRGKGGLVHR
jgi:hypothetical protein